MAWNSLPVSVCPLLTLGLLACSAGCSPVVRSTRMGESFPSRPVSTDVQLYSVRMPDCPFEEIGVLDMEKEPGFLPTRSSEERLDAMKTKARQMGGDAIIGLTQLPPTEGFRGGSRGPSSDSQRERASMKWYPTKDRGWPRAWGRVRSTSFMGTDNAV